MKFIDGMLKGLAVAAIFGWIIVVGMLMAVLPEISHQLIIIAGEIKH